MKLTHPKNGTVIEANGELAKKFQLQGWKAEGAKPSEGTKAGAKTVKK